MGPRFISPGCFWADCQIPALLIASSQHADKAALSHVCSPIPKRPRRSCPLHPQLPRQPSPQPSRHKAGDSSCPPSGAGTSRHGSSCPDQALWASQANISPKKNFQGGKKELETEKGIKLLCLHFMDEMCSCFIFLLLSFSQKLFFKIWNYFSKLSQVV